MTDYSKVFIFVMGSFADKVYIDFIRMRKLLFQKYQIPHAFLFDNEDECPPEYIKDTNDYFFDKVKSPYPSTPNPELNPHMILKFLMAIRMFDLSKYDYILRINLSTYINFNTLSDILQELPKQKLVCGTCGPMTINDFDHPGQMEIYIVMGCYTILSYDVIQYLKTYDLTDRILYQHNDDVILSILFRRYTWPFVNRAMIGFGDYTNFDENIMVVDNYCFVRVRHTITSRQNDIAVWRILLKKYDQIDYAP